MTDVVKKIRALVDIHHRPYNKVTPGVEIIPKGSVVSESVFHPQDIKHLMANNHIEETMDMVSTRLETPPEQALAAPPEFHASEEDA